MVNLDTQGRLTWTRALTATVLAASAAAGAAACLLRSERLAIVAAVGLLLAPTGRLITVHRERWAHVEHPPPLPVRVRRGRVVLRRRDAASLLFLALPALGCAAALLSGSSAPIWAAFGPFVVALALLGLASHIAITPAEVVVAATFRRASIPRHLVSAVTGTREGQILIHVAGREPVAAGVGTRWMRRWDHRGAELKAAGRLLSALDAVPEGPPAGGRVTTAGGR